ncbi:MAG: hypothetical protein ABIO45_01815 [Burkholderiaceae bacterium]
MDLAAPDLFATGTQPGLAPRVKLERKAGATSGFGGALLDAAASAAGALGIAQPDPLTESLSSLAIHLIGAPALSTARLRFVAHSDFPALALGDAITVKLAGSGDPQPVFAGTVAKVSSQGDMLDVLLAGPAAKLARIRRHASYESQGFADLLQAWASDAGITTSRIDAGPDYAFFAIDDRLSLWDWIARVARHAGVVAWADAAGALNARKAAGQAVAKFRYGETVLALHAQSRDPVVAGARIVGEGSAGRQGSDAWSWLNKDPHGVSAGTGPLEQEGGLSAFASVVSAALGAAGGAARVADIVEVRVPGSPALDVASVFALENCPRGEGDGSWQVIELRHRWTSRTGFVTELIGGVLE